MPCQLELALQAGPTRMSSAWHHAFDLVTPSNFSCNDTELWPALSTCTHGCSANNSARLRPSHRTVSKKESLDHPSECRNSYDQLLPTASVPTYYSSHPYIPTFYRAVTPVLRRATHQGDPKLRHSGQTPMLAIVTPLDSFCYNWEQSEILAGRRLVRFFHLQDGNKLMVSAECISQREYDVNDIVISCIYRQATDSCFVTAADIIHLLQRLVEADFDIHERNRIRRNLEKLRPTTVSKTKPGLESFFQQIMDFPSPRPRRIERDIKVFDWKLLPDALDKIVSKYTLFHTPTATSMKEETHSPFPPAAFRQEMSALSSLDSSPDGEALSQLPSYLRSHSVALQSPQSLPVTRPGPTSPPSTPNLSLKDYLYSPKAPPQPIFMASAITEKCPSSIIGMQTPGPSLDLQRYIVEPLNMLSDDDTSSFHIENEIPSDWSTQLANNPVLLSALKSEYGYTHPNSIESVGVYASPQYSMGVCDSFEFQTLRNNETSTALASKIT